MERKLVSLQTIDALDPIAGADNIDGWLEDARGLYVGTKQRKEGIVIRPLSEGRSLTLGGRLSFKVINNDFLLKDEA